MFNIQAMFVFELTLSLVFELKQIMKLKIIAKAIRNQAQVVYTYCQSGFKFYLNEKS